MPLEPFRLELVFTGLCLFELDEQGATVLLVNAADRKRFESDPEIEELSTSLPRPHFPHFSYLMTQQIREGVPHRIPNRIFAGPSGEEVGVCDLEGEDLILEVSGARGFRPGLLNDSPRLSDIQPVRLSPLSRATLPNFAVTTRFRFNQGMLDTLRLASVGESPLRVDLRTINAIGSPSGNPERTIADQLVLRVDDLTEPVLIRSNFAAPILLRPENRGEDLVVANLSNYHREFHEPDIAAFDFLWFYELVEFTGTRPSRRELPIPVYLNSDSPDFTGTSGVCPPIRI